MLHPDFCLTEPFCYSQEISRMAEIWNVTEWQIFLFVCLKHLILYVQELSEGGKQLSEQQHL